jgi:hypothetical protein
MPLALAILQFAAVVAGETQAANLPPTIEVHARVQAKELTIRQQGEARLEVHAEPALSQRVEVTRNAPALGQRRYRNLDIRVDAQATLADPQTAAGTAPAEDTLSAEPVEPPGGSAQPPGG